MNKIDKIGLNNFTRFGQTTIDCASGINVFIGENGAGKTHLLKAAYAFLKSTEKYDDFGADLSKKLNNTFKAGGIANLISANSQQEAVLNIMMGEENYSFSIFPDANFRAAKDESSYKNLSYTLNSEQLTEINTLYIPTHEIVTTFAELRDWLDRYQNNFEETYLDLAKALFVTPTKEVGSLAHVLDMVQDIIGGKVVFENNQFAVGYNNMQVKASLLSEGVKKFVLFDHLIRNQSITKNTILFLDEPEVHLNPKYITKLTDLLIELANSGVQLFIATHDYLFIHQLALQYEYKKTLKSKQDKIVPEIRFHSLFSNASEKMEIESSNTLSEISHNPILSEYSDLYTKERDLFNLSME